MRYDLHNDEMWDGFGDELDEEFRVSTLPSQLRYWFDKGPGFWPAALDEALKFGIRNPDDLANIVFFMQHKERLKNGVGRALRPSEPNFKKLSAEWKTWRDAIRQTYDKHIVIDEPTVVHGAPVDPLPPNKRLDRVINAIIYEIKFNPQIYPNVRERKRVACLMLKLKKKRRGGLVGGKRVDDDYIPFGGSGQKRAADYPRLYALGTGPNSYSRGAPVPSISALWELQRHILRLPMVKRADQDAIRKIVLNLNRDIEAGLKSINNLYNLHGNTNDGAKLLNYWFLRKQKMPESILSCYT